MPKPTVGRELTLALPLKWESNPTHKCVLPLGSKEFKGHR